MFRKAFFCSKCKDELTDGQVYYSGGMCPLCGHYSGHTICDYDVKAYRMVRVPSGKWWKRDKFKREFLND